MTAALRLGKGSVLWGMAMALTNCSWKSVAVAISIFSMFLTKASTSVRAAAFSRAMRAPVPAALPAAETSAKAQSGMRPKTMAYFTSMKLPKAPAKRMRSTLAVPKRAISSLTPA